MNNELERILDREHLTLSSKKKRMNAYLIDELILSVIWLSVIWDTFTGVNTLEEKIMLVNAYVLEFMALKIIYQTFFVSQYGATPGKIIMKMQILDIANFSRPNFFISFNRAFFRVISEAVFYLGFLWGLLDPARQTWHDKVAKTVVIDV